MKKQPTNRQLIERRTHKRHYTEAQFKRAGRLERLRIHMINPQYRLMLREEHLLQRLTEAYEVIDKSLSRVNNVNKLADHFGVSYGKASLIYGDTMELFGEILPVNRKYDRALMRERLLLVADAAEEAGDYAEVRQCMRLIMDLDGLSAPPEKDEAKTPPPIAKVFFTNDEEVIEVSGRVVEEEE